MKKFDNFMIVSDIDGTLVDDSWIISKENIDVANYFMENGGIFTYATGRQTPIAASIMKQLMPNAPVICYNGAAIYDFTKEEYLWTASLDVQAQAAADDIARNFDIINLEINTLSGIYALKSIDGTVPRYEKFLPFFTKVDSSAQVAHPWLKIVIVCEYEKMADLRSYISKQPYFKNFQFSQSAPFLYEFLNPGVNKGQTLLELKKIIGGNRRIIAIGDNENDIDLVKNSDVGFAVGDGSPLLHSCCNNLTVPFHHHVLVDVVGKIEKGLV